MPRPASGSLRGLGDRRARRKALADTRDGEQIHFWIDIDQAPRDKMYKSLQTRREQMVGDAVQLDLDAEHWNRVNPHQATIQIELDFTLDVAWRKAPG